MGAGIPERATTRVWVGLAILALPTLLVSLDIFVMLLALPHIGVDLHASSSEQLWIMDVYGFMVAGFMITMGSLGDRIGRRRLLLVGAAAFGIASAFAAYSTSPLMLIVARALLGLAGATLTPSTLALITNLFADARQRASAVAIWAGCFVVGAIIGPIVGGMLLEHFWWGSVFLLGIPSMVLLLVLGPLLLPEYRDPAAGRLDLASVAIALGAILPVVYGLKELARTGWRPSSVVAIACGVAIAVVFVRRQGRLDEPLLDLKLFTNRAFTTTLVSMAAYSMLSGGVMVFVAQYFQLVANLTPLRAGLAMTPGMVTAIISFQVAPLLARRIRLARLFAGGLVVAAAGLVLLVLAGPQASLPIVMASFMITSLGGGPLVALGTNLVIGTAPPEKAGSAAGISSTGTEFGYALGIAVLGSIGTLIFRSTFAETAPADVPAAAHEGIVGAAQAAGTLPAGQAEALLTVARDAFTAGLRGVALVAAIALLVMAGLILVNLRHLRPMTPFPQTAQ